MLCEFSCLCHSLHSHQGLLAQHSTQLVNDLQKKLSLGLYAELTEPDQFSEFVKAGQTTNIYQKKDRGKYSAD